MQLMLEISFFILGLILGSFINVLVYRFPLLLAGGGIFVFSGRSHCDYCRKKLSWYELFPLLSFLFLRGKCRKCKKSIPARYMAVEFFTGLVFFLLAKSFFAYVSVNGIEIAAFSSKWLLTAHLAALGIGVFSLAVIFFIDLEYFYISDRALLAFLGAGIMESFVRARFFYESILSLLVSITAVFVFFFLIWFFSKGKAMGFGDVKFAPLLPLFLGAVPGIFAVIFGFWLGALFAVFLLVRGRKHLRDKIPFGPFLVAGALLTLFWPSSVWIVLHMNFLPAFYFF